MENYNRLERPVLNDSSPIVVELGLTLLQIIDVDEKNQVLITNAWLQLGWTDIYLSWNPDHYPGVQNLRFPSNQIWTPDILLYNRREVSGVKLLFPLSSPNTPIISVSLQQKEHV
ncbi:hypothetical protein DNTS_005926 [Danionella cerebrum]|uniref:Neurotransmitter-gated ion-channel ligand-binding domain-containing protein n=1 Tax=Danionella cerebrum TaxID=2873325 RepID=A0A553NIW7_9TELE|nr:hypothetical protein DNTS_005926 [Danionella translucida]